MVSVYLSVCHVPRPSCWSFEGDILWISIASRFMGWFWCHFHRFCPDGGNKSGQHVPCVWVNGVLSETLVQVLRRRLRQKLVDALSFGNHFQRSHLSGRPTANHPRRIQGTQEPASTAGPYRPERLSTQTNNTTTGKGTYTLLRSADANKQLVPRSCTASFGLRSFHSSGLTAWNDMPAHLHNLDLSLSDFRQLLKTALFQTVPV